MVSRNPGHIVLLLEPGTALTAANDKFNLAASLSLAGHEVFIAKSADELSARRDAAAPDLILVDASRAKPLELPPVSERRKPRWSCRSRILRKAARCRRRTGRRVA